MAAKKKAIAAKKPKQPKKPAAKKKGAPARAAKNRPTPVIHWEMHAKDAAKTRAFYERLFAWKIDANNDWNYGRVQSRAGNVGIDGGIAQADRQTPGITFYVQVDDIPSYLKKAEALGGKILMPRTKLPMITLGMFVDLEGNRIGLVEA